VRRAVELGVDGLVLNDDGEEALVAVVAAVCAGQVSVPGGHRGEIMVRPLTTRERQILALMITGLTNAQIAAKLFLAESTVKSHLSSAFGKLGVSSRYEAATVILDPDRGRALGIRHVRPDRIALQAT
jgi:two-component system response regulator DesR